MDSRNYETVNEDSENALILTCEHAAASIPEEYGALGLPAEELNRHIARDNGCREVVLKLAKKLNYFAIMGKYSRLLIDLNRRPEEEELIVTISDKTVIPGNQNISVEEKEKRLQKYYKPYYEAIEKQIELLQAKGKTPVIFSIHSYTPQLTGGEYRPWQAGILYHRPTKLADYLCHELQMHTEKKIGENVPYDLRQYNTGTAVICGEEKGFDYALIEIRDDEFQDLEQGAARWAEILANTLQKYPGC